MGVVIDRMVSRALSKIASEKMGGRIYVSIDGLDLTRKDEETMASAKVTVVVKDSSLEAITQNLQLL